MHDSLDTYLVEVIAALKQVSVETITEASWANTLKMFNLK